jgi:hypothetical protein
VLMKTSQNPTLIRTALTLALQPATLLAPLVALQWMLMRRYAE